MTPPAAERRWKIASVHPLNRDFVALTPPCFDVTVAASTSPEDVATALAGADAVLMRGPGFLSGAAMAEASTLAVVYAVGSGTDSIDVAGATELGLPVLSGRGAAPSAVAEYVVAAMVVAHRQLWDLSRQFSTAGLGWDERLRWRGRELGGTTLGLVGFGQIGRLVARMARAAYGVEILIHDPYADAATIGPAGTVVTALPELLDHAATVSVSVPLTPATRGLIGADELRRIGPDGVLINTSRGGVVDEDALVEALVSRSLKAAVLDVFDPEPPSARQLARLAAAPGLLLTPHISGVTDQSGRALAEQAWAQLRAALESGRAARPVNGVHELRRRSSAPPAATGAGG
jgi:phosphoglycerate dehydrogenase-like enzyme